MAPCEGVLNVSMNIRCVIWARGDCNGSKLLLTLLTVSLLFMVKHICRDTSTPQQRVTARPWIPHLSNVYFEISMWDLCFDSRALNVTLC